MICNSWETEPYINRYEPFRIRSLINAFYLSIYSKNKLTIVSKIQRLLQILLLSTLLRNKRIPFQIVDFSIIILTTFTSSNVDWWNVHRIMFVNRNRRFMYRTLGQLVRPLEGKWLTKLLLAKIICHVMIIRRYEN